MFAYDRQTVERCVKRTQGLSSPSSAPAPCRGRIDAGVAGAYAGSARMRQLRLLLARGLLPQHGATGPGTCPHRRRPFEGARAGRLAEPVRQGAAGSSFGLTSAFAPTGLRVERGSREGLGSSARNRRSVTMSPSFCHLFCVGPGSMRAGERGWVRPSAPRVRTQAPPRRASARSGSGSLGEGTRPFPQETVEPRVEWRAQQACAHAVRYAFRARKGSARRDRRPRAFDRKE